MIAALDLQLREEGDGGVIVAFHPIARMLHDAKVSEALAARLQAAQILPMNAVQQ